MIRHDPTRNKLYCDCCDYKKKLFTQHPIIISQELSKAKAAHDCPNIKTLPPVKSSDDRWRELFRDVSIFNGTQ